MNVQINTFIIICLGLTTLAHSADKKEYPKAKESYPFDVKVTDFYGAEGYGFDYYVSKEAVAVVLWDDFGSPKRELLNRPLTKEEARDWAKYWSQFDFKDLKDDYTDPNVFDGLQRDFTFKVGKEEKKVSVANVQVEKLVRLSQKINTIVPDKWKMRGGGAAVVNPPE